MFDHPYILVAAVAVVAAIAGFHFKTTIGGWIASFDKDLKAKYDADKTAFMNDYLKVKGDADAELVKVKLDFAAAEFRIKSFETSAVTDATKAKADIETAVTTAKSVAAADYAKVLADKTALETELTALQAKLASYEALIKEALGSATGDTTNPVTPVVSDDTAQGATPAPAPATTTPAA